MKTGFFNMCLLVTGLKNLKSWGIFFNLTYTCCVWLSPSELIARFIFLIHHIHLAVGSVAWSLWTLTSDSAWKQARLKFDWSAEEGGLDWGWLVYERGLLRRAFELSIGQNVTDRNGQHIFVSWDCSWEENLIMSMSRLRGWLLHFSFVCATC